MAALGDGLPQLEQVVEVPLQLFGVAAHAGGAHDQAHVVRNGEMFQGFFQRLPVFALDATGNTASLRVVRHQHHIAAGQADEGGECGALVAALFLLDLNDDFLAFFEQLADAGLVGVQARREVLAGDFFQRQEAMAFGAVVDEAGFKGLFDASDAAFIDIGLFLFAGWDFDIKIVKGLAIHDGHTQLFTLSCVDQHSFHCNSSAWPRVARRGGAWCGGLSGDRAAAVKRQINGNVPDTGFDSWARTPLSAYTMRSDKRLPKPLR